MSGRARRSNEPEVDIDQASDGDRPSGEVVSETYRVRLIGDLSKLICEGDVPDTMRSAGLALIGYLARRFPGEQAHDLGVEEARKALELRGEYEFTRTEVRTRRRSR
jgi:hypothetical protein